MQAHPSLESWQRFNMSCLDFELSTPFNVDNTPFKTLIVTLHIHNSPQAAGRSVSLESRVHDGLIISNAS